jgi:hypothetical protein
MNAFPLILISYNEANFGTLVEYVSVDYGRTVKGNVMTLDPLGYRTTVSPQHVAPLLHGTKPVLGTATIVDGKLVCEPEPVPCCLNCGVTLTAADPAVTTLGPRCARHF